MVGIGDRWMRDPDTGKGGYVPSDMSYKEWKEIYVDKTSTMDEWNAKHVDKSMVFNKNGDSLKSVLGSISESHPSEMERIIQSANQFGVKVIEGKGKIGYSPGLNAGTPGQLYVSRSDSYGAWLHEEKHMLDDANDGWPGFQGLFNIDRRSKMEYNAYRVEVDLAKSIGREDIVNLLVEDCKEEIEEIGGVWNEEKLFGKD